jgi:hypothetical protein
MKTLAAFAAVLFATSQLFAQTQPAAPTAPAKASDIKPADGKTAPAAKTPVKKDEKKPVPEPKIPGTNITRKNGTFLGLEVVDGNFKLSFYDKKKKPMAPDVTRASARWPNVRGPGDYRTILNSSGNALVGARAVTPPYTWNVFLTLLEGEGDEAKAVESYVVPFRG